MINYLSDKVKKDFEINQIRMITTDYSYKELSKFKLWQLESIKSLILVGFKKDYINEKRLYNFGKGAIKFIIELEMQNKRKILDDSNILLSGNNFVSNRSVIVVSYINIWVNKKSY